MKPALVAFLVLLMTGCESPSVPAVGAGSTSQEAAAGVQTRSAPAAVGRMMPVAAERLDPSFVTVRNHLDLYARLNSADREVVHAFYAGYGRGVMQFARREQLEWMDSNNYPLPGDVLDAVRFTDGELKRRFESGDVVAGFLYHDRLVTRLEASGAAVAPPELSRLEAQLIASGSPFAGYSVARRHRQLDGDLNAAMAGLAWANFRGDHRAGLQLGEMSRLVSESEPGRIDAAAVVLAFSTYVSTAQLSNSGVLIGNDIMPFDADR